MWRLVDQLSAAFAGKEIPAVGDLALDDGERALRRKTHETIRRVTLDLDPRVHLNTAVSSQMELVNELYAFCNRLGIVRVGRDSDEAPAAGSNEGMAMRAALRPATLAVLKEAIEALVLMLSPFAPHMCEECGSISATRAVSSRQAGPHSTRRLRRRTRSSCRSR